MDVYVIFEGDMAFEPTTNPTTIELFYGFRWIPTTGGAENRGERIISIPSSAHENKWKQAILDDIAAWATENSNTIVRLVFSDFSTPSV